MSCIQPDPGLRLLQLCFRLPSPLCPVGSRAVTLCPCQWVGEGAWELQIQTSQDSHMVEPCHPLHLQVQPQTWVPSSRDSSQADTTLPDPLLSLTPTMVPAHRRSFTHQTPLLQTSSNPSLLWETDGVSAMEKALGSMPPWVGSPLPSSPQLLHPT